MNFSNPYFTVILLTVLGVHLLESIAGWLNLRALRPELPPEFRDIYDETAYAKSQAYSRDSGRFDLLSSSLKLLVFLGFWLLGGFGWLDSWVRSLGWSEIPTGLLGMALLYLGSQLLDLPFSWYDTFVIEERHGFNKTTKATFISDNLKGNFEAGLVGLPLLGLLLWAFQQFPQAWWVALILTSVVVLLWTYIRPAWIMPLYNKFTPLADGELKTAVTAMAQRCDFPFHEITVVDGSKRSTHSNAFFAGLGKKKKIALYDTLVAQQSVPELVAVLAHEIGHFKCRHIVQRLVLSLVQMGVLFFLLGKFLNNPGLFEAFDVAQTSVWLSFVLFMFLFQPVLFLLGIFLAWWSRKHEYEADAYATNAVGGPQALITALRKLARSNLSNLTPHPLPVFLHYSHPPLRERLRALAALAK